MLKKITLGLFSMLLSVNLYAGDYDGLWNLTEFSGTDFLTINQNSNQLLFVWLEADNNDSNSPFEWTAEFGTISGNVAEMETLVAVDGCNFDTRVTFTSNTEATILITEVSGSGCDAEDLSEVGLTFHINKIF